MKKLFQILVEHKWAVVTAILVGLIIALPHPYFRWEHSDVYRGVGLSGGDEEPYLTRIQEIRDGHFATASYVWAEGKDLPYLLPPLSEIVASSLGQIFGLDLVDTATLGRLVFPAVVFLLIYALVWQWTKKKTIALAAATTVLLSSNLLSPVALGNLLFNQEAISRNFLPFNRLISPSVHLIFFFGFLLAFWFFLQRKKWGWGAAAGIVLGLSFYTYPYTWTFLLAFLGCLTLIYLWQRDWPTVRNIILVVLVALIVAVPYLINFWQAVHYPSYPEVSLSFGLVKTRLPHAGALVLVLLAAFLLFFARQKKERYYFCLALVLAPLIVLNQQIITGREMQIGHYHWYYHQPLAAIFLIIVLFELLAKKSGGTWLKKITGAGLLALLLLVNLYYAWVVQTSSYQHWETTLIANQRYGPVFDWLNGNATKDQVAMADEVMSYLVPAYTFLNTVSAEDGHYTLAGGEEQMLERTFLRLRLDGLKASDAQEYFFNNRDFISAAVYGRRYKNPPANYGSIPDEKLLFIADKYKEFLLVPLKEALEKYQTDYLIWDTVKHPEWQIEQYPFLKEVEQINEFKIYQLL